MEQVRNFSGRPSVLVIRPADSAETVEAYRLAMENRDTPTVLSSSRVRISRIFPARTAARRQGRRRHTAVMWSFRLKILT